MRKTIIALLFFVLFALASCSSTDLQTQTAAIQSQNPGIPVPSAQKTAAPVLFSDDFENGLSSWDVEDGFTTVDDGGNTVLEGTGHKWAWQAGGSLENFALSVRFKQISGTMHFNCMMNNQTGDRYFIGVGGQDLYLNKQKGSEISDVIQTPINLGGGWHTIEIKCFSGLLNVSVDGTLYMVYRDADPLLSGGIAFEVLEDSDFMLDDVMVTETAEQDMETSETALHIESGVSATPEPDQVHAGDLVLDGSETMTVEGQRFLQQGNIYLNDESTLVIRDSTFIVARGDVPTVHTYFFVAPGATLIIDNAQVFADTSEQMGALVIIRNDGTVKITQSENEIHLIEMSETAHLTMEDTTMLNPIGGLLQMDGGEASLKNCTIGALLLSVPAGGSVNVSGLESGVHYDSFDVHELIPDTDYNLTMENTTIKKDDLDYGAYERGWLFELDQDCTANISDCELRKVFIRLVNDTASFQDLKMDVPSSLAYRDIRLNNVIMRGEWPFEIINSNCTIRNSEYLFLQPSGNSTVTLVDSHVVEFIPRDFTGTIHFENSTWTNAGEIIGGESYHSNSNDFTITGSLKFGDEIKNNLQWKDATVTREYDVLVKDGAGKALAGAKAEINGETYAADGSGKVTFSLVFDEDNYQSPQTLKAYQNGKLIGEAEIDFFTETPVVVVKQ